MQFLTCDMAANSSISNDSHKVPAMCLRTLCAPVQSLYDKSHCNNVPFASMTDGHWEGGPGAGRGAQGLGGGGGQDGIIS